MSADGFAIISMSVVRVIYRQNDVDIDAIADDFRNIRIVLQPDVTHILVIIIRARVDDYLVVGIDSTTMATTNKQPGTRRRSG